jgi:hypothetical protein
VMRYHCATSALLFLVVVVAGVSFASLRPQELYPSLGESTN